MGGRVVQLGPIWPACDHSLPLIQGDSWSNPTIIDVDMVEISGVMPSILAWTFDSEESVHTTPVDTFDVGPMWLNSSSGDMTATGADLSWVGAE